MGGGDLNLKKSWHPKTFRNLKKLWEAEKQAEVEEQKVLEVKAEKKRERDIEEFTRLQVQAGIISGRPKRLEWMYPSEKSGEHLAKKIDNSKASQQAKPNKQETPVESTPIPVAKTRKNLEDPLLAMKKTDKTKGLLTRKGGL